MKFYSFVIFLVTTLVSPALSQEECVEIVSSVERLDCFDQAFSDTDQTGVKSPAEEFNEFSELMISEHTYGDEKIHIVGTSFLEDTCEVAFISLRYAVDGVRETGTNFFRQMPGARITIIFFAAADVESLNIHREKSVEIVMQRGAALAFYNGFDPNYADRPAIRTALNGFISAFATDRLPSELLRQFERKYSFTAGITTRQSQVDRDRIVNELEDVVEACKIAG